MAQVKTYFRGQLPSERTAVPGVDRSGEAIAAAVGSFADTINEIDMAQKKVVNDSDRIQAVERYSIDLMKETHRIRQETMKDPEQGVAALKKMREELVARHSESLSGPVRLGFNSDVARINAEQSLNDVSWKFQQNNINLQSNLVDSVNRGAQFLSQPTTTYDNFLTQVGLLEAKRGFFEKAYGDTLKGAEGVNKGAEAYTRAFIAGQLDAGNSLEVAHRLGNGDFDHFISAELKSSLLDKAEKAYTGENKRSHFMEAADAVSKNYEMVKALGADKVSISQLEESISQASFNIYQLKETMDNTPMTPENKAIFQKRMAVQGKQMLVMEKMRDLKLAGALAGATNDDSYGELLGRFQTLISRDDEVAILEGSLEEVLDFQRDVVEKAYDGKLNAEDFKKWMGISEAAIYNSIVSDQDVMKERSDGGFKLKDPRMHSAAKEIRTQMINVMKLAPKDGGPKGSIEAVRFFMDALGDTVQGDWDKVKDLQPETINKLRQSAVLKGYLKTKGFPIYLTVGDTISTPLGDFPIVGSAGNGAPLLDTQAVFGPPAKGR